MPTRLKTFGYYKAFLPYSQMELTVSRGKPLKLSVWTKDPPEDESYKLRGTIGFMKDGVVFSGDARAFLEGMRRFIETKYPGEPNALTECPPA